MKLKMLFLSLLSIIGFKQGIVVGNAINLVPGGETVGIEIRPDGLIISGTYDVKTPNGTYNPSKDSDIKRGDILYEVENIKISGLNMEEIATIFKELSKEVSEEAIKKKKKGTTIQIVIKYSDFKVNNRSLTINEPTNDFVTIYQTAMKLFEKHYTGDLLRLLGVTLQNLVDEEDIVVQMSLFNYQKHEEESATKLLINELNRRLDKPLFKRASEAKK